MPGQPALADQPRRPAVPDTQSCFVHTYAHAYIHWPDVPAPTAAPQASGYTGEAAARTQACWSGREGPELLRRSAREARDRKAARSATIFINHKYRWGCLDIGMARWIGSLTGSACQGLVIC